MSGKYCIINGDIVETAKGGISPLDRGFMYGDGVFDTMYAPNGMPFLFHEHMSRLRGGLETIGITAPFSDAELHAMITSLISENGLSGVDSYIRTTVTRGENAGKMFYTPTSPTLVILAGRVSENIIKAREAGVKCVISKMVKSTDNPLYRIKSLNFLWSVIGVKAANEQGVDECIFFDSSGSLAECQTSNIFIVKDGLISTPGDDCAILPGITRDYMVDILDEKGISVAKREISREELMAADEVFLTSSVRGVAPVIAIDGHKLETGYTKKIAAIYFGSI